MNLNEREITQENAYDRETAQCHIHTASHRTVDEQRVRDIPM
jgi:hypothetical protein